MADIKMPDYNLSALSPRSFEHMIQALCLKVISPKVSIFGDGPDGAREAVFDGPTAYPTANECWSGYGVIQAKFLQKPRDSQKDQAWLLQQLEKELRKFLDPDRALRRPEYYVICTNVVLSAVDGSGGKDRVVALLKRYAAQVGFKDFDIWDYDKIRALLDGDRDIATTFAASILPGDVLAAVLEKLNVDVESTHKLISVFLQKELLADLYANLEQAGHASDQQIPLSRVFVDITASDEQTFDPPDEAQRMLRGLVDELIEACNGQYPCGSSSRGGSPKVDSRTDAGKYVLIGGPGQGKTTVSQHICQLFRVALLQDHATLSWEAQRAVQDILQQCGATGLQLPSTRRIPFRIVLSDFAKAVSAPVVSNVNSVLSYLRERIKLRTQSEISYATLKHLLGAYPWLVIVDGLDEVPASSNRNEVLETIRDFWVDASAENADIVFIATTRPQGYDRDFSPTNYKHKYLTPLSRQRALVYGERFATQRYNADTDRRQRVVARLERAASEESTSRLMHSPLQVTIMATLVDKIGQPPQERWTLFNEYYKVIYNREMARDIAASTVLRDYRADVDAIHQQVGLRLQIESETKGKTDARMTSASLREIVLHRLTGEGHTGSTLEHITDKIISAAMDRLVFLVGVQADRIGFEIRSLQEFMAAQALMDGTDDAVRERMTYIAPLAHWRNVFLFSAGHCFAVKQYFRDTVFAICSDLNETSAEHLKGVLAGSQLAAELLEDGSVRQQPKYLHLLMRLALRLITLPPHEYQRRVAALYSPAVDELFREELNLFLQSKEWKARLGAWNCLMELVRLGVAWAGASAEGIWSDNEPERPALFGLSGAREWNRSKFWELLQTLRADKVDRTLEESVINLGSFDDDRLAFAAGLLTSHRSTPTADIRLTPILSFNLVSLEQPYPVPDLPRGPAFRVVHASSAFMRNPSSATLAECLLELAECYDRKAWSVRDLPWPLEVCLRRCRSASDLRSTAELIRTGQCGSIEDLITAERRWIANGLSESDFVVFERGKPYDERIGVRGFPVELVRRMKITVNLEAVRETYNSVVRSFQSSKNPRWRSALANCALFALGVLADVNSDELTPPTQDVADLFIAAGPRAIDLSALSCVDLPLVLPPEWLRIIRRAARGPSRMAELARLRRFVERLAQIYKVSPHPEILVLIARIGETPKSSLVTADDLNKSDIMGRLASFSDLVMHDAPGKYAFAELARDVATDSRALALLSSLLETWTRAPIRRNLDSVAGFARELLATMPVTNRQLAAKLLSLLGQLARSEVADFEDKSIQKRLKLVV